MFCVSISLYDYKKSFKFTVSSWDYRLKQGWDSDIKCINLFWYPCGTIHSYKERSSLVEFFFFFPFWEGTFTLPIIYKTSTNYLKLKLRIRLRLINYRGKHVITKVNHQLVLLFLITFSTLWGGDPNNHDMLSFTCVKNLARILQQNY